MATLLGTCWPFCSSCASDNDCFVFYVFSLTPGVYVGTLNLIASIPGTSILTFQTYICAYGPQLEKTYAVTIF